MMGDMTANEIQRLARQAWARLPAGDMTEGEFYQWIETLPENEASAVFCELAEMSEKYKESE